MASLALQLKFSHPISPQTLLTFTHFFSSSSSDNNNGGNVSSYFSDIKSRLKQQEQNQNQSINDQPSNFTPQRSSNPRNTASLDEIRKNLSQFRIRSAVPPPETNSQQPALLQDIYKRNTVMSNPNPNGDNLQKGTLSFESIRQSLRGLRKIQGENSSNTGSDHLSLSKYKDSFRIRPLMADSGGKGMEKLPISVFGREIKERERKKDGVEDEMAKAELIRMYTHAELGEKLKRLRPEVKKRGEVGGKESWFSLSELNERLKKLRVIEEKQSLDRGGGISYRDLRASLQQIQLAENKSTQQFPTMGMFAQLGGTPTFALKPPKEHLIEKYFHPDNMSSEEKLKLELKKVRDAFKIHESDCGSARVQVAQLTTEILHLSAVLHKKDKHSRRGLIAKVQQRKKVLKYLRRTDWDSYCVVLSKLSLRDNPDYKN